MGLKQFLKHLIKRSMIDVKIKPLADDVQRPLYATDGSSGFDIVGYQFRKLYVSTNQRNEEVELPAEKKSVLLPPFSRVLIGAGYAMEVPEGYEIQIRSRSGLALKQGLIVLNSPGTIDSDYRGEIGALICNNSPFAVNVELGKPIAQGVLVKVEKLNPIKVLELSDTTRGSGGFGSTDTK